MAGFIIYDRSKAFEEKQRQVIQSLSNKGFENIHQFSHQKYDIFYIQKKCLEDINLIDFGTNFILSQGTFIYKKEYGREALNLFYVDLLESKVNESLIFGHFNLVFSIDGRISIKSDAYMTLPMYFDTNQNFITSFFLTACDLLDELTPNVDLILSNVVTGCVYDPVSTYFKEINKLNKICSFEDIDHHTFPVPVVNHKNRSFVEELVWQKDNINYIVEQMGSLLQRGVDIGLSSGFDSRLVLAIFSKAHADKVRLHTHWKKIPDIEVLISRKLAEVVAKPVNEEPVKAFKGCSDAEKQAITLQSFFFYDGQVRVNHSLFSQYRNYSYRKVLLGNAALGVTGLGGEQYRNDLSFVYQEYSLDWYVKEYVFDSVSGVKFVDENAEKDLINMLVQQITSALEMQQSCVISNDEIRALFNRFWVKSGPGHRNVAENQLSYFLSLFNDPFLSENALAIRKIGFSVKFQSSLINLFNPELAAIDSNYGIKFNEKNWSYRFQRLILGFIIPSKTKRSLILSFLRRGGTQPKIIKDMQDNFYLQYIELFKFYCPAIDIDNIKTNTNIFDRICGIGFLLKEYQVKLKK